MGRFWGIEPLRCVLLLLYSLCASTLYFENLEYVKHSMKWTVGKLFDKSPSFMNSRIVVLD